MVPAVTSPVPLTAMPTDAAKDALIALQARLIVVLAARNAELEARAGDLEERLARLERAMSRNSGVLAQPGAQLGHLGRQRLHLLPQHPDLSVPGLDHLAEPGIRSAQHGDLIRGRQDIRHEPYLITASAA